MTIYLISTGAYSDYAIRGAYSTRENAEAANRYFCGAIEEYEIDAPVDDDIIQRVPPGMFAWQVTMDDDGDSTVERISAECFSIHYDWHPRMGRGQNSVEFRVAARDEEHAVKIANERRVALIASGEWTTDYDVWSNRRISRSRESKAVADARAGLPD